ncbi:MAG: hypothetical protein ACKOJF_08745 [Planctomycetaceae bacterium]
MSVANRREFLLSSLAMAGAAGGLLPGSLTPLAWADVLPGIEQVAPPLVKGEEQVGQKDIWALEVRFKPVRMIVANLTNPQTGAIQRELVWYMAYRIVVRTGSFLPDETLNTAERPLFVPELTLVVEDEGRQRRYPDRVLPEAIPLINRREKHIYKSSVDVVGPLPAITADKSRQLVTLDGVATWTGVDPDTNNFAIEMAGFSNGYKVAIDGQNRETVQRRTLRQKFWRPSDRFDQNEKEIRFKDEPEWFYQ